MLPKRPFKTLAKTNGVKRISRAAVVALAENAEKNSLDLLNSADEYRKAARRTTILGKDIEQAIKNQRR